MERGLTDEERIEVVRLHNEKRAFLANGMEMRGDPGPQPMAANMMEMVIFLAYPTHGCLTQGKFGTFPAI